jgi:spermidine synthase
MATLLLELALTRVLSVANWYHFGFLVVSTALLGFGASGVTLSLWTGLREKMLLDHALAYLSLSFSFVTLVSFWLMQRIPFQPFRLLLDRWQLVFTLLYYLILAAPFFCAGLAITLLLSRSGKQVHRLYAADLLGAGLGCAAIWGIMPTFGGSGSVVVAATLGLLATVVFKASTPSVYTLITGLAATGMLVLAFLVDQAIPISVLPDKRHPLQPRGRQPIHTAWNSFSKIDVYELPAEPKEGRPNPGFSIIIDAGGAGTAIPDLSKGARNYLTQARDYQPAGLAYVGKKHPKVLIIGSGAGREVLEALYFGASSITAVEINPAINDIVTKRMRQHWGGLFEQPEVQLVTEDGRSFVRRSKEDYDAIISLQTMTDAALTSGALGLSETYVLTVEAFADYWKHLKPDGVLLVTRPRFQIPKLFATTHEMFERLGLSNPANHLFAFRGLVSPFGHQRFLSGFLLQKSPLQQEQIDAMAKRLGLSRSDWVDVDQPEIFYSPFKSPQTRYGALLFDLAHSTALSPIYASNRQLLRPATDDRPFFNQTVGFATLRPTIFRGVFGAGENGDPDNQPVAEVTLVVLLVQAVAVAGVLIVLPLARFSNQGLRTPGRLSFLTYFAGLGLGFIMIEIVLLQRFILFLGQPIYTFSVVLASLLIFTGVGSFIASRFRDISRSVLSRLLLAAVAGIVVMLLVMPPLLSFALGLALGLRIVIAIILIAPLGVVLGMPFPTGLRLVSDTVPVLVPWAWAVNGFFTVIGSVAAVILAMVLGFTAVFVTAGFCYLIAFAAISIVKPSVLSEQEQRARVAAAR